MNAINYTEMTGEFLSDLSPLESKRTLLSCFAIFLLSAMAVTKRHLLRNLIIQFGNFRKKNYFSS